MKRLIIILLILSPSFFTLHRAFAQPITLNLKDSLNKSSYYTSVAVPDGNYRVTVTLGAKKQAGSTTVRAESRRLFIENEVTKKGETKTISFLVNKRTPRINERESVRIKDRERTKLNWDDLLTLEVTGDRQVVQQITIERDTIAPTVFLCGNSTVVDQDDEPWASWGQMITRWFNDSVCFCNLAESGETASTFIAAGRLKKGLSMMKSGDYIIMEFGHNDQKQKFAGAGAYYNFATALKTFVDEARQRGATPIFITPTQRRSFDEQGRIKETHANYPEAMAWVAEREGCKLIDLHLMTRQLFEAMGEEGSKRAFVHYPAGSYPGQTKAFADNTHFNPYGAYQIAKCVIEGLIEKGVGFTRFLRPEYPRGYNPRHPDSLESFHWVESKHVDLIKPDGN
ncbi:MAG: rhamnogalacturonan acetylesterase [Bacteroidaceae bacterium]|nr:rhamnogalacturonan acetylesterase [Bacteroidaceae bacterium]